MLTRLSLTLRNTSTKTTLAANAALNNWFWLRTEQNLVKVGCSVQVHTPLDISIAHLVETVASETKRISLDPDPMERILQCSAYGHKISLFSEVTGLLTNRFTGRVLRTVALRPMTMYGEQDYLLVHSYLATAKACRGHLIFYRQSEVQSLAYVGNTAWAFILASQVLKDDPKVGGEAFFVPDDTPRLPLSTDFVKPFLEERGFTLSRMWLPFWFLYYTVCLLQLLCLILRPFVTVPGPRVLTRSCLKFLHRHTTFSAEKAKKMLGYKPLYTYDESFERSMKFYKELPL